VNNPQFIYNRKSIRIKNYCYKKRGYYFITINTKNNIHLFGKINHGTIILNCYGQIVKNEWNKTGKIRPNIILDAFVIMPNHIHAIIYCRGTAYCAQCTNHTQHTNGTHHTNNTQHTQQSHRTNDKIKNENENLCGSPKPEKFGKPVPGSIPTIIRSFKSAITRGINIKTKTPGKIIWQRNYYEHIIRSKKELNIIRKYIINNPKKWKSKKY